MELINFFSSLLLPIIAILEVCIAYQQHLKVKNKLKFELHEKRYLIYENIKKTLMLIIQNPKTPHIEEFERKNREIVFLFKNNIVEWINEVSKNARNLQYLSEVLETDANKFKLNLHNINKTEHKNNVDKQFELNKWFDHEYSNIEYRFKKYLDFSN